MTTDSMEHLKPEMRDKVLDLEQKSRGDAKEYYDAGVQMYEEMTAAGEKEAAAYADLHIGVASFYLYQWSRALFHCQRAIVEFNRDGNWYVLCLAENLLGVLFANQGEMALAINHFTKTIETADRHGVKYLSALARNNYAEACYTGKAYDTIIRVTGEAKELLSSCQDNPGWAGTYLCSVTQQVRAYLNLGDDDNARRAMAELDAFHASHLYDMDLDEAIARLFYVVRFHPDKAGDVLDTTIRHFDSTPDRNSYIYWIISLLEYLKARERMDLFTHVLTVMEQDMEKVSYPYFQLLLSKYRMELMIREKRPLQEIYALAQKRLALADQEQEQLSENLKYYIELQEQLNENRKKIEAADAASKTDSLTGLLNRRAYEEDGKKLFEKAKEQKIPIGVEILDIDRFKDVNDTYGHGAGDQALRKLARVLLDNAGAHCQPYRLGGDEFVILYEDMDLTAMKERAERIRQELKDTGPKGPQITISQGICCGVPGEKTSLGLFLKQADECLYQSKGEGRDSIEITKLKPGSY